MCISYTFSNFDFLLLLNEKKNVLHSNNNTDLFVRYLNNNVYNKLRWSFHFTNDFFMLHYALISIFSYLSKADNVTCRLLNGNYSVLVDVVSGYRMLHNVPFHFFFYLATFTRDMEKDIDLVYQYWTHGRSILFSGTNMLHTLSFRRRNISFDCTTYKYFFSKYDANLWYHILFEVKYNNKNKLFTLLCSSIWYLSFINSNLNTKKVFFSKKA